MKTKTVAKPDYMNLKDEEKLEKIAREKRKQNDELSKTFPLHSQF